MACALCIEDVVVVGPLRRFDDSAVAIDRYKGQMTRGLDLLALTDPALLARVALLVAASSGLSGCAVGRVGVLAAHVQQRGEVSEVEVYSVGLHLRARADDPGGHLGFSKRTYTFAADDMPVPGWYFLRVPLPECAAIAQDLVTFGIDLTSAGPVGGLSVGYVHTQFFARVPLDSSILIQFGRGLRIDRLSTLTERPQCAQP